MLKLPLRSSVSVAVFLGIVIAAALMLGWYGARYAVARQLIDADNLTHAVWAALVQNRAGFLYQWKAANTSAALPYLRRATELNSHGAAYWVDLARGCELADQIECAGSAYEKAVVLAPMRPGFIWELANYSLRVGDNEKALKGFAQYLRLLPSTRERTFRLVSRGIHDPALLWEKVVHVSGDPETELAYLNFYKKQDAQAETAQLWSEVMEEGKLFPASAAVPYVDRLLEGLEYDQAKQAWTDMQAKGIVQAQQPDDDLVYNGNFEEKPLNGGFDWRLHEQPYLYLDVAQPASCRESRCLYVNFTVPQNLEYEPVYEIIPVKPHQLYSLSAYVRSQDITSDSGPRLRVVDPQCEACITAMTSSVIETRPWHKVEVTFMTGPRTQVLKLSVFRQRSRVFPMEISGEFWLDSVSLKLAGGAKTPAL